MLTDNNSQMSVLAARTGFVYTVLYGLKLMANNTGYSQVSNTMLCKPKLYYNFSVHTGFIFCGEGGGH